MQFKLNAVAPLGKKEKKNKAAEERCPVDYNSLQNCRNELQQIFAHKLLDSAEVVGVCLQIVPKIPKRFRMDVSANFVYFKNVMLPQSKGFLNRIIHF